MSLREHLLADIERLEAQADLARQAVGTLSLDWPRTRAKDALVEFMRDNGPDAALGRYAAARRVLQRHKSMEQENFSRDRGLFTELACEHCDLSASDGEELHRLWPCDDVLDLASSLGISSEEGTQP